MDIKEAFKVYLRRNTTSKKTIKFLMLWDSKLTMAENAIKLKTFYDLARSFAVRYGLSYKKPRKKYIKGLHRYQDSLKNVEGDHNAK